MGEGLGTLKQYVFSLCVAGVISTAFYMLLPEKSGSKIMKTALGVFFLCALISPFLFEIDLSREIEKYSVMTFEEEYEDVKSEADKYLIEQFEIKVKELVLKEIEKTGVDPINVLIEISENEIGELVVERTQVFLKREDVKFQTDVSINVKNITDITPEIYFTQEN